MNTQPAQEKLSWWIVVPALALLLLAAGDHFPYGFYILLRFVVCGTALFFASEAYRRGRELWLWVLGALAVLFNPLVPVRMRRQDWELFDVLGAMLLTVAVWQLRRAGRAAR
jgi:hypothetical protein